jgi:hypothetical protein
MKGRYFNSEIEVRRSPLLGAPQPIRLSSREYRYVFRKSRHPVIRAIGKLQEPAFVVPVFRHCPQVRGVREFPVDLVTVFDIAFSLPYPNAKSAAALTDACELERASRHDRCSRHFRNTCALSPLLFIFSFSNQAVVVDVVYQSHKPLLVEFGLPPSPPKPPDTGIDSTRSKSLVSL